MIQIEDTIISLDVFERYFVCDLVACKGACCVEGDAGAPLLAEEETLLQSFLQKIKPFMREEGILAIRQNGVATVDEDGDLTTTLVNHQECAFVTFEQGIAKCAIEKAYNEQKIDFKKPISCHLFPIRIKQYNGFEAINYEQIKICEPACKCGKKLQIPVYAFLKEPLIRKYGEDWYNQLVEAAKLLKK